MKDSLFSDDLENFDGSDNFAFDDGAGNTSALPGMRHSIRRRSKPSARSKPVAKPVQVERPRRSDVLHTDDTEQDMRSEAAPMKSKLPQETVAHPAPAVLSGWHDLHKVDAGARQGAGRGIPVVDLDRDNTTHRAFDLLRTRLRQTTQENKWVNIGVTAATTGCGTTFTAVNLALSLSRVAQSRTVLMDMNLRDPKVMEAFDMSAPGEMHDYLSGAVDIKDHMMRISDTLALGLNSAADYNAAETLQNAKTHATLDSMRKSLNPELVIYDLPPMLVSDDVSAFLPQLDGVLLVSDGTKTTASQLLECERMLDGQVPLLGVVLNRARSSSIPRYS